MELWPTLQGMHILETLIAITAVAITMDSGRITRAGTQTPQLAWMLSFVAWTYAASSAQLGVSMGISAAWATSLGPIFMVVVWLALRDINRLRTTLAVMLVCTTFISAVAIHQSYQPRECIELLANTDSSDVDWVPDGRECSNAHECETGGRDRIDYACERVGLLGTFSTQGRVRWRGQLNDPNELAVIVAALVPFALMFGRERGAFKKITATLFVTIAAVTIVLTQSRGGMLALATVLCFTFGRWYGARAVLGAALAVPPLLGLTWRSGSDAESSSTERAELLFEGLQLLQARPFFGTGARQFASENSINMTAHNSYLLIAAETGVIGYFLWCGMAWATIKIPFVLLKIRPSFQNTMITSFSEALAASTLGMHVGIFFLSFSYKHIFFVWMGFAGALYCAGKSNHSALYSGTTRKDVIAICALAITALAIVRVAATTAK